MPRSSSRGIAASLRTAPPSAATPENAKRVRRYGLLLLCVGVAFLLVDWLHPSGRLTEHWVIQDSIVAGLGVILFGVSRWISLGASLRAKLETPGSSTADS
jgi:hypothetical protein